jgi:hypothetical protein
LQNLAYDISRLVALERMAAASGKSVPSAPPKGWLAHKTKHIRYKINSKNDRWAVPVIDARKTSSLFEMPYR